MSCIRAPNAGINSLPCRAYVFQQHLHDSHAAAGDGMQPQLASENGSNRHTGPAEPQPTITQRSDTRISLPSAARQLDTTTGSPPQAPAAVPAGTAASRHHTASSVSLPMAVPHDASAQSPQPLGKPAEQPTTPTQSTGTAEAPVSDSPEAAGSLPVSTPAGPATPEPTSSPPVNMPARPSRGSGASTPLQPAGSAAVRQTQQSPKQQQQQQQTKSPASAEQAGRAGSQQQAQTALSGPLGRGSLQSGSQPAPAVASASRPVTVSGDLRRQAQQVGVTQSGKLSAVKSPASEKAAQEGRLKGSTAAFDPLA